MDQITVARIPELLARIVKELEVIDGWLTLKTEPILNGTIGPREDWIDIYELRRMIPGGPNSRPSVVGCTSRAFPIITQEGLPCSDDRKLRNGWNAHNDLASGTILRKSVNIVNKRILTW